MFKNRRHIEIALKIVIVLLFSFFLSWQIFYKKDSNQLWAAFQEQLRERSAFWLLIVCVLMPLNWLFEALKWRRLADSFQHFSVWLAFKSVLAGAAIGIFTPNRVGEYGGRLLFTPKDKVVETVVASLLGSFGQLLAILTFGVLGLYTFLHFFYSQLDFILNALLVVCLLGLVIILFLFYNTDILLSVIKKIYKLFEKKIAPSLIQHPTAQKIVFSVKERLKHVKILQNYSNSQLSSALLMAYLRYTIYTIQYYCMLRFMGVDIGIVLSIACITTIFLLQTCLPLPPVTGLFARGGTAVYIWNFCNANEITVLATTFGLWLINVIFPALIGLIFILRKNYFTEK